MLVRTVRNDTIKDVLGIIASDAAAAELHEVLWQSGVHFDVDWAYKDLAANVAEALGNLILKATEVRG